MQTHSLHVINFTIRMNVDVGWLLTYANFHIPGMNELGYLKSEIEAQVIIFTLYFHARRWFTPNDSNSPNTKISPKPKSMNQIIWIIQAEVWIAIMSHVSQSTNVEWKFSCFYLNIINSSAMLFGLQIPEEIRWFRCWNPICFSSLSISKCFISTPFAASIRFYFQFYRSHSLKCIFIHRILYRLVFSFVFFSLNIFIRSFQRKYEIRTIQQQIV